MCTVLIHLAQDIKKKWFYIEVKRLVIQKQFCQQTQILTVNFVFPAIHFPDTQCSFAVDFFPNRLSVSAFTLKKKTYNE